MSPKSSEEERADRDIAPGVGTVAEPRAREGEDPDGGNGPERRRALSLRALRPEASTREQLQVLRATGLKDREIAAVAGNSTATIRRWRREGTSERTDTYDDLRVIIERLLAERMIEPALIAGWVRSRNAGLSYERPLDALARGEFSRVMHVVECLIAGSVPLQVPGSGRARLHRGALVAPGSDSDPHSLLEG